MFRESLVCAPLSGFARFVSVFTPVAPEVRASLSLPRESDKERPGSPPGPRAGRQPSSGGCRPGLPLDSRPNPGLHWPPGRIGAPCTAGPGRGASAQPATGRGRFWADVSPLGRMQEISPPRGPKGSLEPLRIQWRARLPGPSRNPALHRTAHSFTRGRAEAWNRP